MSASPYSFSSSSSSSAEGKSTSTFDSSGWTVNLGGTGGVTSGALAASGGSGLLLLAGAALVGLLLWKRKG